jgi:hypothetical protein
MGFDVTYSTRMFGFAAALALAATGFTAIAAQAQDQTYRHRAVHRSVAYGTDRPLTIGPRRGPPAIIRISPNEVYAPGGFSAHSWHPNFAQRQEMRKEARNQFIREATSGIYGYGLDGLGGTGFDTLRGGYDNPNYGNAYNRYVGYNGLPTDLSFGPSFAFRHLTGPDPEDDEDAETGPSPADLGFSAVRPLPEQ